MDRSQVKGATYWSHVGKLEVGVFFDAAGKPRLALRGDTSVDNLKAVHTAIDAIVACAVNSTTHESEDTGRLHMDMIK